MSAVETFFEAWGLADDQARAAAIADCFDDTGVYADPRSDAPLQGTEAVTAYVSQFSANAPGWTARVVKSDTIAGMTRATVAFGGMGPDGTEMVQHGQYFVELTPAGSIARMVGFVGTGTPE